LTIQIFGKVKIKKLLIIQIPQASCYFHHFRSKYSQRLFSNTLSLCSSNNARYQDQRSVGKSKTNLEQ
jgi:hypothetical protein